MRANFGNREERTRKMRVNSEQIKFSRLFMHRINSEIQKTFRYFEAFHDGRTEHRKNGAAGLQNRAYNDYAQISRNTDPLIYSGCHVLTGDLVRSQVFCDIMLCRWVNAYCCLGKERAAFRVMSRGFQEEQLAVMLSHLRFARIVSSDISTWLCKMKITYRQQTRCCLLLYLITALYGNLSFCVNFNTLT